MSNGSIKMQPMAVVNAVDELKAAVLAVVRHPDNAAALPAAMQAVFDALAGMVGAEMVADMVAGLNYPVDSDEE